MAHLSIRLLGAFTVERNQQPVTTFRSLKNQALLAYLAVEAARSHTRPALAGLLWPEQPEVEALLNLRQALFRLRNALANDEATPPYLQITQSTVQFGAQSDHWLDAVAFTHLLAACDTHARTASTAQFDHHRRHCPACMARLAQAVDLYQGEFMHGIYINDSPPLEEWILLRREWFHHQALAALYDLAAWYESQGDYARAYTYGRRQIALDPLREEAHRQLMRSLALDGKRSEALAQYEACCTLLYQELGVPPDAETTALLEQIEAGTLTAETATAPAPVFSSATAVMHNLPASSTAFIGRDAEITRLREVLLDPAQRLVTVVGPGGVGKTRLALATAASLVGAFADGVWLATLAGVEEGHSLLVAIASALRFTFQGTDELQQQLFDYLRKREALLLLDNFEQLIDHAELIQHLLAQAPRLKVLVTSRERLHFQQEWLLTLTGLPTPPADTHLLATQHFGSVQLFVERAQRAAPAFSVDEESQPAVVEICRLVEGLPLGIELAAAWTEHYTCAEIAQALRDNLDFLNTSLRDLPARHRSLRAAFDYSWRLLPTAEQQALAQMTIFRGAFSRAAAQAVTGVALPQLTALVNKSLVRTVAPGRYAIHEVIRQFAATGLSQPADAALSSRLQQRHAAYYLQVVANQAGLFGQTPQKAVAELMQEIDNVRQAWRWAVLHGNIDALRFAIPNLARLFDLAGLYQEAITTWESALARWQLPHFSADAELAPAAAWMAALLHLEQARTCLLLSRYTEAQSHAQRVLAQAEANGDGEATRMLRASAHHQLGLAHYRLGDQAAAQPYLVEAVALAQQTSDRWLTAECLLSLGEVQMYSGEPAGRASFAQALTLYRAVGDRRGEGAALNSLGVFAQMQSDFATSRDFFEQALRIQRALGDRHNEGITLNSLATFYGKQGDYTESDQYLRQSLHLARALGYRIGEVQALTGLGTNQMYQHQASTARAYFEDALVIARQSGYLRGEGALLNNLGNLASDEGAYGQAEAFYQQALTVARKSGDQYYTCGRLHNLGNMRRFQGDYVGAQSYYAQAVAIAESIGDRWIEGSARADLALAALFLCDETEALHHAHMALHLARTIGDRWCECKVLALLGWFTVVDQQDVQGLALIDEAITLAQAAHEVGVEGAAHARRGFTLLWLGDATAAIPAFQRSIALRRQLGDGVQIVTALAGLAHAQLAHGDLTSARIQVEAILRHIGEQPIGVADTPIPVYATCSQVLHMTNDHRATPFLQRAVRHLADQGNRLTNVNQQARFVQHYKTALQL